MTIHQETAQCGCAHLRILWRTWKNSDGSTSGHWVCDLCSTQFCQIAALAERDREIERLKETVEGLKSEMGYHEAKDVIKQLAVERDALRAERDALVEVLELYVDRHDSDWTSSTRGRETACPCRTCDAARAALSAGKGEG